MTWYIFFCPTCKQHYIKRFGFDWYLSPSRGLSVSDEGGTLVGDNGILYNGIEVDKNCGRCDLIEQKRGKKENE